jgi:thiol:disulfide interchange protein
MEPEADSPSRLDTALAVLLRLAGVAWLAGAVVLWGRLVGYFGDTITPAWHDPEGPWLTTLTAAVVFPVVAVGLWLLGRWGVVLWVSAVAAEVVLLITAPRLLPFGVAAVVVNILAIAAAGALAAVKQLREGEEA